MEMIGLKPDALALRAVLSSCRYGGLMEEAMEIFRQMRATNGMTLEHDHYHIMVDLLAKNGQIREAELIIASMPFPPNASIWRSFLEGYKFNQPPRQAEFVQTYREIQDVIEGEDFQSEQEGKKQLEQSEKPADWCEKQDSIPAIIVHDSNILADASSDFSDVVSYDLNVIAASNFDNADSDFMPAVQYGANDVPAFYINFTAVDFHNNTTDCSKSMVDPVVDNHTDFNEITAVHTDFTAIDVLSDNNVLVAGEFHGVVSDLDVDFITATADYDFNAADSEFYVHSELNNVVAVVADFTPAVFADFSSADFAIVDADIHTPLIQDIQQPSLDDVCLLQHN
ncbi:structure-specific endonuclease subunit SLX1 [Vigna unguiculata]|uniref:Structure-specific endonuclease subunit SLX1 n=1 Tax=Vigna unguiculata TaxID=3917 RepID=A0A4D6LCH0_VIGUN|nr:structure-specific endonuclease subunit SLX1 [Vigna unguiculata]